MKPTLRTLMLLGAGLLAASCDGGRTDLPNVDVRIMHAAPGVGPVTFRRERANATLLDFKQARTYSFDVDDYTFNFEIMAPDGSVADTVSVPVTLTDGSAYTFVLREVAGQPAPLQIERSARGQTPGIELQILHAATTIGAVDVFVEPPDFDLAAATAWGTIDFDGALSPRTFTGGDYEIALTEAGNRANVLLRSETFSLAGSQDVFLVIVDGAGEGLAPLSIAVGDDTGTGLVDRDLQSGIRVINAVSDGSTIDAGIDLQLAPPLIPSVAFATASSFALIASGEHDFNVTPEMNPGVIEITEAFDAPIGRYATWLVTGAPGTLNATLVEDDFRVISGESKLRIFHGSPQNGALEVFVEPPGADLADATPKATPAEETASGNVRIEPGDYEITVRDPASATVLAGPTPVTIAADAYYGILLTDTASGTGVDVALLFDFN